MRTRCRVPRTGFAITTAMGTELRAGWRVGRSSVLTPESALLLLAAAAVWLVLVFQAHAMGSMGGTMSPDLVPFILVWTMMMAAMMLPAVAPVANLYARRARGHRSTVVVAFAIGYLAVWALVGVLTFPVATFATSVAMDSAGSGRVIAVAALLTVGLYQLSPAKVACLVVGRSRLLDHADTTPSSLAGLAAGARDGVPCVGSSWPLILVMVPFGFMNVKLMLTLAAVVFVERYWSHGLALARVVGAAALLLALALASSWAPHALADLH
jgi:predicted metal-binding membrane protein